MLYNCKFCNKKVKMIEEKRIIIGEKYIKLSMFCPNHNGISYSVVFDLRIWLIEVSRICASFQKMKKHTDI